MFSANPLYDNKDQAAVKAASDVSNVEAELEAAIAIADNPGHWKSPRLLTGTGNKMRLSGNDAISLVQALQLPNGHVLLADGQVHTKVAPQTPYAAELTSALGQSTSPQQHRSAASTMHSCTCIDEYKPGAPELMHPEDHASADVATSTETEQQHLDDMKVSMPCSNTACWLHLMIVNLLLVGGNTSLLKTYFCRCCGDGRNTGCETCDVLGLTFIIPHACAVNSIAAASGAKPLQVQYCHFIEQMLLAHRSAAFFCSGATGVTCIAHCLQEGRAAHVGASAAGAPC